MSITVCQSQAALCNVESEPGHTWLVPTNKKHEHPDESAILSIIQSQPPSTIATAYVHPLIRKSASFMSLSSLEMCTEGIGSETGFGDTTDDEEEFHVKDKGGKENVGEDANQHTSVIYHCSGSRKSATGNFPPPLSSISSRDGSGIQMRTHRYNGRLVMEAVPLASQNCLNARRHDGRLLLFADSATTEYQPMEGLHQKEDQQLVVVRKEVTPLPQSKEIVNNQKEVKISAQPQQPTSPDNNLLFTSKLRNREEMVHYMRRCNELQRLRFFGEAGCIATSS